MYNNLLSWVNCWVTEVVFFFFFFVFCLLSSSRLRKVGQLPLASQSDERSAQGGGGAGRVGAKTSFLDIISERERFTPQHPPSHRLKPSPSRVAPTFPRWQRTGRKPPTRWRCGRRAEARRSVDHHLQLCVDHHLLCGATRCCWRKWVTGQVGTLLQLVPFSSSTTHAFLLY